MLKVIFKGAVRKPSTRLYPFEKRASFVGSRGSLVMDIDKCTFCTLCEKKCPSGAIKVNRAERVWELNRLRCIVCGACVDVCAKKSLSLVPQHSVGVVSKESEIYRGKPLPPKPAAAPTA
jgi:formate hydrogenlyase subunit 6/NADH:ubiquinone oxidoreductase subunit I